MAVLGARTNNTSMLTSSLKSAGAKNPALAKKAATDLEFAKYYTNAQFHEHRKISETSLSKT